MIRSPGVSVVVAAYNGARHLAEQLDSIGRQTDPPVEILVSDDGSSDETPQIVNEFARVCPVSVEFHRNRCRLGYADNFLSGAARSRAELIAFCDQDDVWLPNRLEQARTGMADPDVVLWVSGWLPVNEDLTPIRTRRIRTGFITRSVFAFPLDPVHGCRMVFRASLLDVLPPENRPESIYGDGPQRHDEWVTMACHAVGRMVRGADATMLYRRHRDASSASDRGPRWSVLGDVARDRARYLRSRADVPGCASVGLRLLNAASYYERLAPSLDRRRDTRTAASGIARATNLARAVSHGDYRRLDHAGLGLWNLILDARAVVA